MRRELRRRLACWALAVERSNHQFVASFSRTPRVGVRTRCGLCGDGDCFNGLDHFEAFSNFDGDANDASVNGRNLKGGYQQGAGKLGSAASFSGANQGLYPNTDL